METRKIETNEEKTIELSAIVDDLLAIDNYNVFISYLENSLSTIYADDPDLKELYTNLMIYSWEEHNGDKK